MRLCVLRRSACPAVLEQGSGRVRARFGDRAHGCASRCAPRWQTRAQACPWHAFRGWNASKNCPGAMCTPSVPTGGGCHAHGHAPWNAPENRHAHRGHAHGHAHWFGSRPRARHEPNDHKLVEKLGLWRLDVPFPPCLWRAVTDDLVKSRSEHAAVRLTTQCVHSVAQMLQNQGCGDRAHQITVGTRPPSTGVSGHAPPAHRRQSPRRSGSTWKSIEKH